MKVLGLELKQYRNLETCQFVPDEGINVIWGSNAQGKTNLLESIWLFTGGHSFRGSKDSELVRLPFGEGGGSAELVMRFWGAGRQQEAKIVLRAGKRSAALNGVSKKTASSLVGAFCAVVFSPEHLSLVKDGPGERRAFLDGAICQVRPAYASLLANYSRTLQQRNMLLKDIPRHSELLDTLEIWDERLSGFGGAVMQERFRYTELLRPAAVDTYRGISCGREEISLSCRMTACEEEGKLSAQQRARGMMEALRRSRRDDLSAGFTTVGPHRDDLQLLINGASARAFGSQGQQRSIVLALKLAEASVLETVTGEPPVILLDDVMSELDVSRQDYLLNHLEGRQVFITCCDPESVHLLRKGAVFQVEEGRISGANQEPPKNGV